MFGITMLVKHNGRALTLRAMTKLEVPFLVEHWNSMRTHLYTMGLLGVTLQDEEEWFDKTRKDPDGVTWVIVPDGESEPIGVTSLHHINSREGSCSSGIIIWRQDWWGKGVASAANLARTLFASDYLNRSVIRSSVRTANPASFKALERVGYTVWGTEPRSCRRAGKWLDTHMLVWLNPERIEVLYPDGLPTIFGPGVERAQFALETARKVVDLP